MISGGSNKLKVLSPGVLNNEAGPDFLNSMITLDGKTLRGDVEIHLRTSDWERHAHSGNPAYANVILHVVMIDDTPSGKPDIPVFELPLSRKAVFSTDISKEPRAPRNFCANFFRDVPTEELRTFFISAGMERFRAKSAATLKNMITSGAEREFTRLLFDAAGYKKNRESFMELFKRYSKHAPEIRESCVEALLWGESGLMPDPTYGVLHEEMKEFLKGRWNTWWRLRKKHYPPIKWVRSGVRPVNSPERRNAALCGILKHTENRPLHYMITAIEKISDPCKFYKFAENFLSTKDPLWENFTNFSSKREKPASLMGRNRILELTVNVLLPALFASGELRSSARLKKFAVEAWIALPPTQNNSILKIFEEKWFANKNKFRKTLNSAATRQGAIHIYRNFCEKNCGDCLSCPLRASLLPPENS